jgi:hypothetical protein
VAGTSVQLVVSPEEVPGSAAELAIVLEPFEDGSSLEAPTRRQSRTLPWRRTKVATLRASLGAARTG